MTDRLSVACPLTWPAKTACNAWGAPSAHGCKKEPGHDGICRCPCGSIPPPPKGDGSYPSASDETASE